MSLSHTSAHEPGEETLANRRRLALVLLLTVGYMWAEVVAGLLTGSLALLADAGHMLTDAGAVALALFANWLASQPPSPERTFGFYRIEVLGAFLNGLTLAALTLYIFWEALRRFQEPPEVNSLPMLLVAFGGLIVNLAGAFILKGGKEASLNIQGAFLHVLGDALGSVGAMAGAVVMLTTGWYPADPLISIFIGFLILLAGWRLIRATVDILLEAVPRDISLPHVRSALLELESVSAVHDLHVWTLTSGFTAMSGHLVVEAPAQGHGEQRVLQRGRELLQARFGIAHSTLQLELPGVAEEEAHCEGDPRCLV